MKIRLPMLSDAESTLSRWGAELRKIFFLTEDDFLSSQWKTDWDPVLVSTMTISAVSTRVARYFSTGNLVHFCYEVFFTTGGVAATTIQFDLPISVTRGNAEWVFSCLVVDGFGTTFGGVASTIGGENLKTVNVKRYDNANWGLGNSRGILITGFYESS